MGVLSFTLLLSILPLFTYCQSNGGAKARQAAFSFPVPDSSESYHTVDSLNATWTSTYEDAFLRLWCRTSEKDQFGITFGTSIDSTGSKVVLLNLQVSGTCHFAISDRANPAQALTSADFDVAFDTSASPLTYSLDGSVPTSNDNNGASSSATSAASPNPTADPSSSPSTTDTSTTPTPPPADTGLTTGQGVGIGVGVAAGSVLLVTALILLFLRTRQRRKERAQEIETAEGKKWVKEISTPRDFRRVDGWDGGGSSMGTLRAEAPPPGSATTGGATEMGSGNSIGDEGMGRQEAVGTMAEQELESPDTPGRYGMVGGRGLMGSARGNEKRERGQSQSTLGIGAGTGTAVEPASELDSTPIKGMW